jgi:glycosyltransferase involved in cell wall biosynthesis
MTNLLGGTEIQFKFLEKYVDYNIRYLVDLKLVLNSHKLTTDIDTIYDPKKTIVCTHQSYDFLEAKMISDQIQNINNVVFVSEWQKQKYIQTFDLPKEKCMVIPNGIEPAKDIQKPKTKKINLIYFNTPYRGLDVLLDSLEYLQYQNYHLHVFSSMDIYGQSEENIKYEDLYDQCKRNHRITYHGSVPHDTILQALNDMHIMAYPCIFEETCCISALEAMSRKLKIVCSDLGALPETTAGFATMYTYTENKTEHAKIFAKHLDLEMSRYQEHNQNDQKLYVDNKHDWNNIKIYWNDLFKNVLKNNKIILNYGT